MTGSPWQSTVSSGSRFVHALVNDIMATIINFVRAMAPSFLPYLVESLDDVTDIGCQFLLVLFGPLLL